LTIAKPPFLKIPYGGYYHRDRPAEDSELTHVGPGTPCGEYLRRFWQPIPITQDLTDLPIRVRLLGEDLVLFRNKNGFVGLLELHCSHRGTSLEFGLIEKDGIRCCYHGWMFGVDGRILDTPGEPPDSTYKERLCHGAYPVHDFHGLLFTYMGPPDKRPPFPIYDSFQIPGYDVVVGKRTFADCNWLQIADNSQDPSHTAFLHTRSSGGQFFNPDGKATQEFGELGELDWIETPVGMSYISTRRVGKDVWVRMGEMVHPNLQQTPGNPVFPQIYPEGQDLVRRPPWFSKWLVPIDDTNTLSMRLYHVSQNQAGNRLDLTDPTLGAMGGNTGDRPYEDRQRRPGDYEAEAGQGPIAIHALEHLGYTDRGITMLRKLLRRDIQSVRRGEDPKGFRAQAGGIVPTYCCDTIMRIPPACTSQEDSKLLKQTGRRIAEGYLKTPPRDKGYT
jgi:nitrite reductase/ring-hydroxylating ferredoxin subunit